MNDIVKAEPQDAAITQLLTIKPEAYVVEVFKPFKKELAAAVRNASKTPEYDITTTAGLSVAKQLRKSFSTIRTTAENTRKERKAPIIQIGKLLDTKYAELETEIREHEDKYDAQVKSEEARKERIKQEELARERARIEAIENRLANIRAIPSRHLQSSSDVIRKEIDAQSTLVLDPADYDEFHEDAIAAVNAVLVELERMRKLAAEREEEARRIEVERAELARLKAEKEQAERKLAAEAAAKAEEERLRQAAIDAEREASARRIAELEAQLAASKQEPIPAAPEVRAPSLAKVVTMAAPAEIAKVIIPDAARPSDDEIIEVLALRFRVHESKVIEWLCAMDLTAASNRMAEVI